jgi:hypothetical protein
MSWTKRISILALMAMLLVTLSGCLYPEDQRASKDVSAREAILTVQDAVDRYKRDTGLLPIENAEESDPLYEKFQVDFGKLQRMDYLASIPTIAYENGGSFKFLIIDEETKPLIKLMDLSVYQTVNDVQRRSDEYRTQHRNAMPVGDEQYPGFRVVDYGKLGGAEPVIVSMYSRHPLVLLADGKGTIYADYGADILTAAKKSGKTASAANADLRRILVDASYYVPVKSPVYHWSGNDPIAVP